MSDEKLVIEQVRVQDAVAKVAGVGLGYTIRVLLSFMVVSEALGNTTVAKGVRDLLEFSSVRDDTGELVINTRATEEDYRNCNEFHEILKRKVGRAALKEIRDFNVVNR